MAQDAPPETHARRPPLAGVGHLHPFGRSLGSDPEGRDPALRPQSVVARCGNPAPPAAARSALDLRVAAACAQTPLCDPTPRACSPRRHLTPPALPVREVQRSLPSLPIQSPATLALGAARPAGTVNSSRPWALPASKRPLLPPTPRLTP